MAGRYERRVSAEEAARNRYLLVEKRAVGFFPPEGAWFQLDGREARVESYACTCRGPERPHRHWFLRVEGLHESEWVVVEHAGDAYRLVRTGEI